METFFKVASFIPEEKWEGNVKCSHVGDIPASTKGTFRVLIPDFKCIPFFCSPFSHSSIFFLTLRSLRILANVPSYIQLMCFCSVSFVKLLCYREFCSPSWRGRQSSITVSSIHTSIQLRLLVYVNSSPFVTLFSSSVRHVPYFRLRTSEHTHTNPECEKNDIRNQLNRLTWKAWKGWRW